MDLFVQCTKIEQDFHGVMSIRLVFLDFLATFAALATPATIAALAALSAGAEVLGYPMPAWLWPLLGAAGLTTVRHAMRP